MSWQDSLFLKVVRNVVRGLVLAINLIVSHRLVVLIFYQPLDIRSTKFTILRLVFSRIVFSKLFIGHLIRLIGRLGILHHPLKHSRDVSDVFVGLIALIIIAHEMNHDLCRRWLLRCCEGLD